MSSTHLHSVIGSDALSPPRVPQGATMPRSEPKYGTWRGHVWQCECVTHYLLNDYTRECTRCGCLNPNLKPRIPTENPAHAD